jgi:two-component system, OmpR family, response regulator RegX3
MPLMASRFRASQLCKSSDQRDLGFMVGRDSRRVAARGGDQLPRESSLSQAKADPTGPSVLLVEDEQSIAEPFAHALSRGGFRTTVARTGAEAIALMETVDPDVVLLDLALPDGDGRDVCRRLRRESDVPIIIVTASGTVTDRVVGLELGADDYVVKPFATGEVIARIRAVLRRGRTTAADSGQLVVQDLRIDPGARRAWLGETELELTRKEFDLLVRLAQDAGRVVSRESLMSDVWDVNWFGSTKTLDVHIGWLRRKLGDDPANPTYVHTVRGVGFRLASKQESRP